MLLALWLSILAAQDAKRFVHPGTCGTCHVDEKKTRAPEPKLCLGCHDGASAKLIAAHRGQPFQNSVCSACHSPHGSNAPKLIYDIPHGPFAGRHCDECHAEPEDGKIRINGGSVKDLCLGCHVVIGNRLAASKSGHAARLCTDCHTPHASNFRPHLKMPREKLCAACHKAVPAATAFVH